MRQFICIFLALFSVGAIIPASTTAGHDIPVTRISIDSEGHEANGTSSQPTISADARFVAFTSTSSNLAPGHSGTVCHILVHDRTTGKSTLASVNTAGIEAGDNSLHPSISDDGRFVAFASFASNLVEDDTNESSDVFVHDCHTGETSRISVDSRGNEAGDHSSLPAISADGRFVAFSSDAGNLVPGDTNGRRDIFVHDRHTGELELVSVNSAGHPGNSHSYAPDISANGRFVAFYSYADNLVLEDFNRVTDIFIHDRQNHATHRCSISSNGEEADGYSLEPGISGDGQYIVFSSFGQNLVPGDKNRLRDVFLHHRVSKKTVRISNNPQDTDSQIRCLRPKISANGRYVTYIRGFSQLFIHDRATGSTEPLTTPAKGYKKGWITSDNAISGGGELVVFSSTTPTLVNGDSNNLRDIFAISPGAAVNDTSIPHSTETNRQSRQTVRNACE